MSAEATVSTTSEVGWPSSTTVNVAVEPDSVTVAAVPDRVYPAVSSSSVVAAVTVWSAMPSKALSLLSSSTAMVTAVSWLPSTIESSTPVMVTDCGTFQLLEVNVNVGADTFASLVSADETATTTSESGWVSRTTVSVAVEPASVTDAVVVDNVNAAVSSSAVVAVTVW